MSSSIKTEVRQKVSATFNFEGHELTISFYGEGEFLSRLVACWNACQVITDPENVVPRLLALNELVPDLENQAATLRAKRDELLAALEKIAGFTLSQFMGPHDMALECVTVACDAIAKVKGGAA